MECMNLSCDRVMSFSYVKILCFSKSGAVCAVYVELVIILITFFCIFVIFAMLVFVVQLDIVEQ